MTPMAVPAADAAPVPERQRELTRMVRQECGFCHGLRLTGGLGAPITPAAMQDKPAETMTAVILHGIPGTAMPGWSPFLTEAEAGWIVEQLKRGLEE
jgi:cytochrome c55X